MRTTWLKHVKRYLVPNSLRFQLLSRSLFILAGLLLLIGLFQYVFMKEFVYSNQAERMQNEIISFPRDAWQRLGNTYGSSDPNRRPLLFGNSSLAFIDLNGRFAVLSNSHDGETPPPELEAQEYWDALQEKKQVKYRIVHDEQGSEQILVLQPVGIRGRILGIVQISTSTKPLKDVLFRQLFVFLMLSLTSVVFGLLAFIPVLKKTLIPLSNLVDKVERIHTGNLAEKFSSHQGQLEIDRLAVSFNGMLERLELSFAAEREAKEQMRRFIADASHELRTPLTSIHGFLEILLRGASHQPDQLDKALKSMYSESERINKLVLDLLLLVKLDRTPHIELTMGNLDTVVQDMETQLLMLAGGRKVNFQISQEMRCMYDTDKIKQVILNLFHNAVQHTDPVNGQIEVSLKPYAEGIQFSVEDNGPGINKQHIPHLFDRFYRSDSSRTRKYGGSGLGLSITKSIVEIHGGIIHLESTEGEGTAFHVWLPAAPG